MKTFLKFLGGGFILLLLFFGLFLFWINYTDYMPETVEELQITQRKLHLPQMDGLTLISWNIGYAGLGKEMDFFYDGGKKTRTDEAATRRYLEQIKLFMQQEVADIWLLQEVDFKAKRTYKINQAEYLSNALSDWNYVQAVNYDVPFVPVPLRSPMGQVKSGMMTFSRFSPRLARRYAFPQIAGWPDRMFLLDRCFIETRYGLQNGAELVVLNTHNSAFVDDQLLMQQELEVIHSKMLREYELGNYVIAGGDWNMNPGNFNPVNNYNGHYFVDVPVVIPNDFLPFGWQIVFDPSAPTNRNLHESYTKGSTGSTSIDFFMVSPNVEVNSIKVIDLGFENSDHNPVKLYVKLRD